MYEDEDTSITEAEVVNGLRQLLSGDELDDTLLNGATTETYAEGGYLTYDEGFTIDIDGHRFQITVKQEC